MKAKKSYENGGKRPKGLKRPSRTKGLKPMTEEQKRNARTIDMDRLKDPRTPRGLKKSDKDNSKMVDAKNLKKKKRKVVPLLSKKGSNRKMK